jgi:hypothetical protein
VNRTYRIFAGVLGAVATGVGLALIAVTAARGGGSTGYVIGALFTMLGSGRLYVLLKRP